MTAAAKTTNDSSRIFRGCPLARSINRYVVLSEEDFDKVRPELTRVIDLVQFADDSAIDPMYVDRAYYLAPDGDIGQRRRRRPRPISLQNFDGLPLRAYSKKAGIRPAILTTSPLARYRGCDPLSIRSA